MALRYSYLLKLQEQMARKEKASDIGKKWKKKKKGIMYGSLLLYKDSCSATGPTNTKDSAQLWSTMFIGLRVVP